MTRTKQKMDTKNIKKYITTSISLFEVLTSCQVHLSSEQSKHCILGGCRISFSSSNFLLYLFINFLFERREIWKNYIQLSIHNLKFDLVI